MFYEGGLDIVNRTVLSWNRLDHVELVLHGLSSGTVLSLVTNDDLQGMNIIGGDVLHITQLHDNVTNSNYTSLNDIVGSISFWGNAIDTGQIVLSVQNYSYQGRELQESVANFNITIGSIISSAPLNSSTPGTDRTSVPTILTFQVVHNATSTKYEYGAYIDWSGAKEFPVALDSAGTPLLTYGQTFSLVAQDDMSFYFSDGPNGTIEQVRSFSTDPTYDTATYLVRGKEMCQEMLCTQFAIDGGPSSHNTTRVSCANSVQGPSGNTSSIYVMFSGFRYGENSSIIWIKPCSFQA